MLKDSRNNALSGGKICLPPTPFSHQAKLIQKPKKGEENQKMK
jgi:hypothetical protein